MGGVGQADPDALAELSARHEFEMDPDSVPGLTERVGLNFPGDPDWGGWRG